MMDSKSGKSLGLYVAGSLGGVYIFIGTVLLIFSGVLAGYALTHSSHALISGIWALAYLCVAMGLVVLFRWFKYRHSRISIYEHGFTLVLYGKSHSYNWHDVAYVVQRKTNPHLVINAGPALRRMDVRLKLKNGKNFKFSRNIYPYTEKLAHQLQQGVANSQYAQCLQELTSGNTLRFGVLSINLEGIQRFVFKLPWKDLGAVECVEERMSPRPFIKRKDNKIWSRPYVFQVPNHYLFIRLADVIRLERGRAKGDMKQKGTDLFS